MKKIMGSSLITFLLLTGCQSDTTEENNTSSNIVESEQIDNTTTNDSNETEQVDIKGKVADGYLVGAKVCLDKNQNMICDKEESFTITDNLGGYSLVIDKNDVDKYPILIDINKSVVDLDTNKTMDKEYILLSPAGKTKFISPFSTLVYLNSLYFPDFTLQTSESNIAETMFPSFEEGNADTTLLYNDYILNENNDSHNLAKGLVDIFVNNLKVVKESLPNISYMEQIKTAYLPLLVLDDMDIYSLNKDVVLSYYNEMKLYSTAKDTDFLDKELYSIENYMYNNYYLDKSKISDTYYEFNASQVNYFSLKSIDDIDDWFLNQYSVYSDKENIEKINEKTIISKPYIETNWCFYDKEEVSLKENSLQDINYRPQWLDYQINFNDGDKIYFSYWKTIIPSYQELADILDNNDTACIYKDVNSSDISDLIDNNELEEYEFYPNNDENGTVKLTNDYNTTYKIVTIDDIEYLVISDKFFKVENNKLYRIYFDNKSYRGIKESFNKNAMTTILNQLKDNIIEKEGKDLKDLSLKDDSEIYTFNENNLTITNNSDIRVYSAEITDNNYSWIVDNDGCNYQEKIIINKFIENNLENNFDVNYSDIEEGYNPTAIYKLADNKMRYVLNEIIPKSNIDDVVDFIDNNNCFYAKTNKSSLKDIIENNISFNFIYTDDWKNGKIENYNYYGNKYEVITIDDEDYLVIESYDYNYHKDELYKLKDKNLSKVYFDYKDKNKTKFLFN